MGGNPGETIASSQAVDRDRYLREILSILTRHLREKRCQVYWFGSRAAGSAREGSDYDIAVASGEEIERELSLAREALELSNIPYTVDLVDLRMTSEKLAQHILTEGVLLWSN
ncbi:MAG: nucleotidyltransferase domain-containing protein [Acidobacteria bacterium]|nr:nucleotidyltransferase domain-containing protein [Acidobacteriota bacterium]